MDWKDLTAENKEDFKEYCDGQFGKTIMFGKDGEPLYLDKDYNRIQTEEIILFSLLKRKI